jgi:sulfoxide reductase catalytic subunit YedY
MKWRWIAFLEEPMLIKPSADFPSSEITPKKLYLNRRKFMTGASAASIGWILSHKFMEVLSPSQRVYAGTKLAGIVLSSLSTSEKQTSFNDVTHYNNFYEFGVGKEEPAEKAKNFQTTPWTKIGRASCRERVSVTV